MSQLPTFPDVLAAHKRLAGHALRTPTLSSPAINQHLDLSLFFKCENLQRIGAFKFRGAYNRLCQLDESQRALGVVAFSSGNHAQGIALAAKLLGIKASIVMPTDAPILKLEGTERLGATILPYDRATESREDIAANIAASTGATLVPAFEDLDVIAGQGTCGLEIMEQLAALDIVADQVLTPCGGGGLLAGTSTAVKAISAATKVYGVEQENYDDHLLSKRTGERVKVDGTMPTMCDALMATTPGEITWSINSKTVDDFLVVSEDNVAHAISYASVSYTHLTLPTKRIV